MPLMLLDSDSKESKSPLPFLFIIFLFYTGFSNSLDKVSFLGGFKSSAAYFCLQLQK